MYLYIFEDGGAFQSDSAPTVEDFESIEEGILDVFEITIREILGGIWPRIEHSLQKLDKFGHTKPIPKCEIVEDNFHAPCEDH